MAEHTTPTGHAKIETSNTLMIVLILIAVAIGGLVEIVPLFFQRSTTQPVPGLKPYPADAYRWIEVQHAFGVASPNPSQGAWEVEYVRPDGQTLATCAVREGTPDCG